VPFKLLYKQGHSKYSGSRASLKYSASRGHLKYSASKGQLKVLCKQGRSKYSASRAIQSILQAGYSASRGTISTDAPRVSHCSAYRSMHFAQVKITL